MPDCYLCGSSRVTLVRPNEDYAYLACGECGLRRQHPVPAEQDFAELYDERFYEERRLTLPLDRQSAFTRALVERRAARLTELHGGPGRLLDVGAGTGLFLEAAARRGWDGGGVEVSAVAVRLAAGITSLPVRTGQLEDVPVGERYDAVTLWDVLEHLPDPRAALVRVRHLLDRGGVVAISLPSVASLRSRLRGSRWRYYQPSYGHISHFSPSTLRLLLQQAGLRPLSIETSGAVNLLGVFGSDPEAGFEVPPLRAVQGLADRLAGIAGVGEHLVAHATATGESAGVR